MANGAEVPRTGWMRLIRKHRKMNHLQRKRPSVIKPLADGIVPPRRGGKIPTHSENFRVSIFRPPSACLPAVFIAVFIGLLSAISVV